MRRKIKTVMEQMNAEKPDDVLADLERKHGCAAPPLLAGERVCENDFVFLDHAHRPYRVRKTGGEHWLYYWSKSKQWVSLRKCTDDEALQYIDGALKPGLAKYYEAGVPFLAS